MKVIIDVPNDVYYSLLKERDSTPEKLNVLGLAITNGKTLTNLVDDIKSEIDKLPKHLAKYINRDDVLTAIAQYVINECHYMYENRKTSSRKVETQNETCN